MDGGPLLASAQQAALPGPQGSPLPFPRWLGPSEVTCSAEPAFCPVGTLRAAVPPAPADGRGQPGRARGSLPRAGWGR